MLWNARLAPKRLLVLPINPVSERYSRQILFAGMGEERPAQIAGIARCHCGLRRHRCFCGPAACAGRSGDDFVSSIATLSKPSNLHRQALFDENDPARHCQGCGCGRQASTAEFGDRNRGLRFPTSLAKYRRNSCRVLPDPRTAPTTLRHDSCSTTLLFISDKPWIYAAAVGSYGLTCAIRPERRLVWRAILETPPAGSMLEETCDTV